MEQRFAPRSGVRQDWIKEILMASTVWKGHLTFGLVSLPVRLFSAARAESVSFNLLHKSDNSRIKQVTFCQAEDKPVSRSELVKGYEYEKDQIGRAHV